MNVTLCSAFRSSVSYIRRYEEQVRALAVALAKRNDRLSCVWGEGDSTDDTRRCLRFAKADFSNFLARSPNVYIPVSIVDVSHGGKEYGSVVDPQRFKQLAGVWQTIWAAIPENSDVVIFAESDLIWTADVMIALIDRLKDYPCVAPMISELSTGGFFDVWAYRKDGKHFTKHAPYFDGWPPTEEGQSMVQIDSAGSVLAMNAQLARHLVWPEEDVVVGLCRGIYQLGGAVFLDTSLSVAHA